MEKTELINNLQELYLKEDFAKAQELLLEHKDLFSSGIFHYNMGTFFYKQNNFPSSRYHFEKSIKENFINSMSLNNLMAVKEKLEVKDLESSTTIAEKIIDNAFLIPSSLYSTLSLIMLIGVLIFIKMKLKTKKILSCILLFISILPFVFGSYIKNNYNYAIALKNISVKEGPSNVFPSSSEIPAGIKLLLEGPNSEGWYYVKSPKGRNGWVTSDSLGIL